MLHSLKPDCLSVQHKLLSMAERLKYLDLPSKYRATDRKYLLVTINHIFEDAHKRCCSYAKAYQHDNIILDVVLRSSTIGSI